MPILPDYLATINNRTTTTTLHYTSLNAAVVQATGIKSINASGGLGILGAAATAQHLAYRNLDGTAAQQQQLHQQQQQQQQHIMTKHPIPGKSMVNFSLIHLVNDDNNSNNNRVLIAATPSIQNEQQKKLIPFDNAEGNAENYKNLMNHTGDNGGHSVRGDMPNKDHNHYNDDAETLADENGSIGILLSMKALVQLIFNPIVGNMSSKYGYRLPIVMGTFCLLISSLGKILF